MKTKLFILFTLFILPVYSYSFDKSEGDISQLEKQLLEAKTDEEKIDLLHALGKNYFQKPHKAIPYLQKALELSKKINDKNNIAKSLLHLGNLQGKVGNKEGLFYMDTAIILYEEIGNQEDLSFAYYQKGTAQNRIGNYQQGIETLIHSLQYDTTSKYLLGNTYNNIGYAYVNLGRYDSALHFLNKASLLYSSEELLAKLGNAYANMSFAYMQLEKYDSALIIIEKGIKLLEYKSNYTHTLSALLNYKGQLYERRELYSEALNLYLETLKIDEENKDIRGQAITLCTIGDIYTKSKEYQKAKAIFLRAIQLYEGVDDKYILANLLSGLALSQIELGDYEAATATIKRALFLTKEISIIKEKATLFSYSARMLEKQNKMLEAIEKYEEAHVLFEEIKTPYNSINSLISISKIYTKIKQYHKAEVYIEKAFSKLKATPIDALRVDALSAAAELYIKQEKYQKAYTTYSKHIHLKDSLDDLKQKDQLNILKVEYELHEKEQDVKMQNQRIELLVEDISYQKKLKYTFIIIGFLLLIIGLSLVYIQYKIKTKNRKLNLQAIEIQKRKQEALQQSLHRKELEENQLKQDIRRREHDLTSQALHLIKSGQLMDSIVKDLKKLQPTASKDIQLQLKRIERRLKNELDSKEEWEKFKSTFEIAHPNFYAILQEKHPNLTPYELKLCALLRLNFNIKELAEILSITPDSVAKARSRLRKKLNLEDENLNNYLITI